MMGVIVLWYLYPTIVQYLVGLMRCRTLDSGGEVYLIADLSLKCSEPIHAFWMFLLFVFIIVYVIGIPWGLHILLRYEGKNWTTHQMRFRVGFLYKGHDLSDRWWWEAVTFARKAVITCIVVLCSDVTRMGSYVVVWVLEACFILHFYASPYANEAATVVFPTPPFPDVITTIRPGGVKLFSGSTFAAAVANLRAPAFFPARNRIRRTRHGWRRGGL